MTEMSFIIYDLRVKGTDHQNKVQTAECADHRIAYSLLQLQSHIYILHLLQVIQISSFVL